MCILNAHIVPKIVLATGDAILTKQSQVQTFMFKIR